MRGIRAALGLLMGVAAWAAPQSDGLDAYMRHLAQEGQVQIVNETVSIPGLHALTRFEIQYRANWDYEVALEKRGEEYYLQIRPQVTAAVVSVKHTMKLPEGEEQKSQRYRVLLLHEYDHVAISADGRVKVLLQGLLRNIAPMRVRWTGTIPPPKDAVNAFILEEMESRKRAVVSLVDHAYKKLDRESDHGRATLPNRAGLFLSLFTEKHLEESKFPYLEQGRKVLNSVEAKTATRLFRF
ncbi:MAG TPA: hypothetical protein PLX06_12550 [Fimbriimonadaceae bacterium]|nr:hypothetical protein [Fimbriimonadaceae bacterium]